MPFAQVRKQWTPPPPERKGACEAIVISSSPPASPLHKLTAHRHRPCQSPGRAFVPRPALAWSESWSCTSSYREPAWSSRRQQFTPSLLDDADDPCCPVSNKVSPGRSCKSAVISARLPASPPRMLTFRPALQRDRLPRDLSVSGPRCRQDCEQPLQRVIAISRRLESSKSSCIAWKWSV